jgi:hypothetical protein
MSDWTWEYVPDAARVVGGLVQAQAGSTDWPLHTCGTISSSSGAAGRKIVKSWNYTEFFPLNWSAVADYQAAHHALYGRYPSFARLMKNARIKDQVLVFDEL